MWHAAHPQTSHHPTLPPVPPTAKQSLAKQNRKRSQMIENKQQRPKSIASFCRLYDDYTAPPCSRNTNLRVLTATKIPLATKCGIRTKPRPTSRIYFAGPANPKACDWNSNDAGRCSAKYSQSCP